MSSSESKSKTLLQIGNELDLFFFDDVSPGSCFFTPHGTIIYNKLIAMIRKIYKRIKYNEIITPVICDKSLWQISGHWDKYKENMFIINKDKEDDVYEFSVAPMSCPKHCIFYKKKLYSYRDLPLRLADFAVLHRNEVSGSLGSLFRCRKFCQDDAHIFCTLDQIEAEIELNLGLIKDIYTKFGFTYTVGLSTKPEKYIGSDENWDKAESILKNVLTKAFGDNGFKIHEKGGAFYGPKIDVHIKDSLSREHQCGTIQLDFNLPEKFELKYKGSDDNFYQPVMIHRAVLGSIERFMGILIEHYQGKLPFFISPRQIIVIPVADAFIEYAKSIQSLLEDYHVDVDTNSDTISKKVFNAESLAYNMIIVVGKKEKEAGTICIRNKADGKATFETMTVSELLKDLVLHNN